MASGSTKTVAGRNQWINNNLLVGAFVVVKALRVKFDFISQTGGVWRWKAACEALGPSGWKQVEGALPPQIISGLY